MIHRECPCNFQQLSIRGRAHKVDSEERKKAVIRESSGKGVRNEKKVQRALVCRNILIPASEPRDERVSIYV